MDRVTLVHGNFRTASVQILDDLRHCPAWTGLLFDLGRVLPQLDDAARGFSYMHDAPLDMRMDASGAADRP